MKPIAEMTPEELAALVCQTLEQERVRVTLTGGGCVAIWSGGRYVSHDLDFIAEGPVSPRRVGEVLRRIGFTRKGKGRHFTHPGTEFYVEFPNGPLMVGNERVERVDERETAVGRLRLLSPSDCVKDRLAAFFHWNDHQALEQALLVAKAEPVDLKAIRRWAKNEDAQDKLEAFERKLSDSG